MDIGRANALRNRVARIAVRCRCWTSADSPPTLHRAHLMATPYENLDLHLGRALTLDRQATFREAG